MGAASQSAAKTVDRMIDVFPAEQQNKIRATLSESLRGVVAQNLFKRIDKKGRVAALEILVFTTAVANLVREGKTHQMYSVIETSAQLGMQTMDRSLADIFRQGVCAYEECLMRSVDKENFARLAKGC